MLRQLLVGGGVRLGNIAIQAVVMASVVGTARRSLKGERRPRQIKKPAEIARKGEMPSWTIMGANGGFWPNWDLSSKAAILIEPGIRRRGEARFIAWG